MLAKSCICQLLIKNTSKKFPNFSKCFANFDLTSHFFVNITFLMDIVENITYHINHVAHKHSSKNCQRYVSSEGLGKIYMGYFILGAPASESFFLHLKKKCYKKTWAHFSWNCLHQKVIAFYQVFPLIKIGLNQ